MSRGRAVDVPWKSNRPGPARHSDSCEDFEQYYVLNSSTCNPSIKENETSAICIVGDSQVSLTQQSCATTIRIELRMVSHE